MFLWKHALQHRPGRLVEQKAGWHSQKHRKIKASEAYLQDQFFFKAASNMPHSTPPSTGSVSNELFLPGFSRNSKPRYKKGLSIVFSFQPAELFSFCFFLRFLPFFGSSFASINLYVVAVQPVLRMTVSLLCFSGFRLRHLNVAYIDDTTQSTHFVKKSGHVMVWSSDFYLEWDLGVEIPVHLFLWLKQHKFQAGLCAEIGNAAQ